MARPIQVSGDGWATDRPVGGLGRTAILRQKWLRDKTVNTHHDRQYKKRVLTVHNGGQNKGERRRIEKRGRKTQNTKDKK